METLPKLLQPGSGRARMPTFLARRPVPCLLGCSFPLPLNAWVPGRQSGSTKGIATLEICIYCEAPGPSGQCGLLTPCVPFLSCWGWAKVRPRDPCAASWPWQWGQEWLLSRVSCRLGHREKTPFVLPWKRVHCTHACTHGHLNLSHETLSSDE